MTVLDVLNEYKDYLTIITRRNGNPIDIEKAKIIIDALEKRIEKKVENQNPVWNEYDVIDHWEGECPNCKTKIAYSPEEKKYCDECGQRIDWSDTE